jgi:hypothetical protein
MRIEIEVADDRGKALETWDNRYRLSPDADGAVRTEVVSAVHNGKDETAKERAAQAKRDSDAPSGGGSSMAGYLDDPFDPALQDSVEILPLAGARKIAGVTCTPFAFTLSKQKGASVAGTAWLDTVTGLPVEVVSSPKPLPRGAHELATTVYYTDGFVSEVRVEGSGSLLFLKRRFSSVITLGGWFHRPGR